MMLIADGSTQSDTGMTKGDETAQLKFKGGV